MKYALLFVVTLALLGGAYASVRTIRRGGDVHIDVPTAVDYRALEASAAPSSLPAIEGASPPPSSVPSSAPAALTPVADVLPPEVNIASVFYPQAPDADWSQPWQETCEEASIALVANTYKNEEWSRAEFKQQLLELVAWENEHYGDYRHTDQEQMVQILRDVYDLHAVIHEDPSLDEVKRLLANGHLLIGTFSGKELGNPYYSNGGPTYHALVLKGYTSSNRIITNDVGTKRGADYVFRWATLQQALRDYADPITGGDRRIIEVLPP